MESIQVTKDWLDHLASEATFFRNNKKPSLFAVEALLGALGRPDKSYEYRIIVGGTAGKGTVCKRIESVLVNEGKKVVTLTSPHIQDVRERININGEVITEDLFVQSLLKVKEVSDEVSVVPTYYEALIVAGAVAGQLAGCNIMIAEVGLGGIWDGVNAFQGKRISAVTFIGDDHREILGPKLSDIAREKAGIFTNETIYAVSYEQKFRSIFNNISKIKIEYVKGVKQKLNKKLAQKICKFILQKDFVMTPISLPARWEVFLSAKNKEKRIKGEQRKVILDGAHSEPRFEFILPKLKKLSQPPTVIFAMTKNHDPKSFKILQPYVGDILWTTVKSDRAFWQPEALQEMFGVGKSVEDAHEALKEALEQKIKNPILIIGSFYLCGELRALLQ